MNSLFRLILCNAILLLGLAMTSSCAKSEYSTDQVYFSPNENKYTPVDAKKWIEASSFDQQGSGVWETKFAKAEFPFDEMVYSWLVSLDKDEAFEIYLETGFPDDYDSGWQFAGYWGDYKGKKDRSNPTFERGTIYIDQLVTKSNGDGGKFKADKYRFKVVSTGEKMLTKLPELRVITTDNNPSKDLHERYLPVYTKIYLPPKVYDIPLRAQATSKGEEMPDTCQTAAMAATLEFLGDYKNNEDLFSLIYDEAYHYPGVWPRVTGVAAQHDYNSYIDRFREWDAVKFAIADNKLILASINMPENDSYLSPPYPKIGGHIIVINGLTNDGRVVVTDSALAKKGTGYRCQWLIEDLEKIWMKNKGGVALVVEPKVEGELPVVSDLPPFPREVPEQSIHYRYLQK